MFDNKTLFVLLIAVWSCSMKVFGVSRPQGPLQNHVTGGFKRNPYRNSISDADCSQFTSDYDILYQFPFQIMINPMNSNGFKSTAYMRNNEDFVYRLDLNDEDLVPLSIFCLKNLNILNIFNVSFPNGVVPDSLGNLRDLNQLNIYYTPITKITKQLGFLRNLNTLYLDNCNLTNLPDLSGIVSLSNVGFSNNQLSNVTGLTNVYSLGLSNNLFTDVPTIKNSANLHRLYMSHNPIKNMVAITSYTNLQHLSLGSTNIPSIPPTIDKLQKLSTLVLNHNRLFYLPTNIFNLPNLKHFNIQNNLFSSSDIRTFQERFKSANRNVTLYI